MSLLRMLTIIFQQTGPHVPKHSSTPMCPVSLFKKTKQRCLLSDRGVGVHHGARCPQDLRAVRLGFATVNDPST